jgi:hypothetical protein
VSTDTIAQYRRLDASGVIVSVCRIDTSRPTASRLEFIMATVLSQHSSGRILLHIIALIVDRQIRWHCAGIARELRP